MDDLLREFLTETGEHLDVVDVELVRFEREPGNETILRNIFRLVHTIKGTCGFLGLPRLEALAAARAAEPEPQITAGALVYQVLERALKPGEVSLDDLERAFRDTLARRRSAAPERPARRPRHSSPSRARPRRPRRCRRSASTSTRSSTS